ncbi:MFS transporter [Massilia sp. CCM 8733]|uniref:MFS transporter n=1 Tax=Massilia mucilaginosa TaxID=2609282 RepID=A0ABX0NPH1_9BURK|nr:MFS transporter [Massilia mucilaginosa]NHZ88669.1 MFS transporter [Massilia mucilaginosa]
MRTETIRSTFWRGKDADPPANPAPGLEPAASDVQKTSWQARAALFFTVFLPFALGQYMHALLRNVNAVLVPDLVASLSLNPGQLGLLTSTFFFSVVLAQLPTAYALERHGPHKVQLAMLLLAALGALMFAYGQTLTQLVLARAVIGFGVGGTMMVAVKAISAGVVAERLPSSVGFLIAFGGLGSASATLPLRRVLEVTDWRGLFIGLAVLTAAIALFAWMVRPRKGAAPTGKAPTGQALLDVWRNRAFRKTITLVLLSHTIYWGMQGLWIGRWLSDVARFPEGTVAYLLYLSMAAVIFGAIAVGMITEWAKRRGIAPLDVAAVGVAGFVLVQCAIVLNHSPTFAQMAVLFTLVGTITGIEYTIVQQSLPRELAGPASSCLNMLIFIGAFLVQAGFGQLIGLWAPDAGGHYPAIAYRVGFGVLVLLQLPGLVMYALGRRAASGVAPILVAEEDFGKAA